MRRRIRRLFVLAVVLTAAAMAGTTAAHADGPGRSGSAPAAPKPDVKVSQVGTDVHVAGDDVVVRRPRTGGGAIVEMYRAAAGVGGQRVLDGLIAEGLDPSTVTTAAEAQPIRCTTQYGSAAYLGTNPGCVWYNWRWNGFDDPQVYFRDHTPARWPVHAAVTEWNRSPGVDSYWTTGGCPGGGRHCVDVWNANYGATWHGGAVGYTYMEVDSAAYFIDGAVVVHFNDYYSSSADNRGTACHELGHALGLAHNGSTASCLYASSLPGTDPQFPHSTDIQVLQNILYR